MAINTNQSPAETLAADTKSGLQDLIQTGSNKAIAPKQDDLVQVASLSKIINPIIKKGDDAATEVNKKGPQTELGQETVEQATLSVNKANEILGSGATVKGFDTSEEIIANLKSFSDDIETPVSRRPFAETIEGSNLEVANVLNMSKNWNKNNTLFSDSQVVAIKKTLVNSSESLKKVAKKIKDGDTDPATTFLFRKMLSEHAALVATYRNGRANVARALNAFKIPVDYVGSQSEFELLVTESLGGFGPAKAIAEQILDPKNTLREVNNIAAEGYFKKTMDGVMEIYINGLLSSPRTQFRNNFGNAFVQAFKIPEMGMAATWNAAEGAVKYVGKQIPFTQNKNYFNTPTEGVTFEQVYARMYSYQHSAISAFKNASIAVRNGPDVDKLEISQFQKNTISAKTFGYDENSAIGYGIDTMGKLIRLPGTALVWGDEFFKTMAKTAEQADIAMQKAQQYKRQGFSDDEIAEKVTNDIYLDKGTIKTIDDAKKASVFQDDLGPSISKVQKVLNDTYVGRVIVPFFRTPINIFKMVYDRSYGGVVKGVKVGADVLLSPFIDEPYFEYTKRFKNDAQFRTAEMGKYSMSAMAFTGAAHLKNTGSMTGPPPRNPRERDYQRDVLGIQPHSFVFYGPNSDTSEPKFDKDGVPNGDLRYVSYLGIEPFGSYFGITANCIDFMERSDIENDLVNLSTSCVAAGASYFKEIPFLQGISQVYEFLDLDSFGEETILDFNKLLQQVSKTISPFSGLGRDFEKIFDPEKRYYGGDYELDLDPYKIVDGKFALNADGTYKPNPNYGYPKSDFVAGAKNFGNLIAGTYPTSKFLSQVYDYEFQPISTNNGMKQSVGLKVYNAFVPFTYKEGNDIKKYQADIYRLNVPGYSKRKTYNGINLSDPLFSKLNETAGTIRINGLTFSESLEQLYAGGTIESIDFLGSTGSTGGQDDYRRTLLQNKRKEFINAAFNLLAESNKDFAKIKKAVNKKQELLNNNELSRFDK